MKLTVFEAKIMTQALLNNPGGVGIKDARMIRGTVRKIGDAVPKQPKESEKLGEYLKEEFEIDLPDNVIVLIKGKLANFSRFSTHNEEILERVCSLAEKFGV